MRRAFLFALFLASCKDDPAHGVDCTGEPDFDVFIYTVDAPLPANTIVSIKYAGGVVEEFSYPDHEADVLFCEPTDRNRNPVTPSGGGGQGATGGSEAGQGGQDEPGSVLEALDCELWTDGPAEITIQTSVYPTVVRQLSAEKGVCTYSTQIEVGPKDGGA